VLLESPWEVRFNRVYFTIFRAKVGKVIFFSFFLSGFCCWKFKQSAKNWVLKEKSVEPSNVFTFAEFKKTILKM
jgi:hypothetical protein